MPAIVPRGAVLSAQNPILDAWVVLGGQLAPPYSLAYSIWDVSTDAKLLAPVRVFPPVIGEHLVDLVLDEVSPGRFAASGWTVSVSEVLGRHEVRWTAVPELGAPARTWRRDFDVAAGVVGDGEQAYALPSDARDEGVGSDVAEARLQIALLRASEFIDRATLRHFAPRFLTSTLDADGRGVLRVGEPIMAIASASYASPTTPPEPIDLTQVLVYDRWLREGLLDPDDRNDPRLAWAGGGSFRRGDPAYATWRDGRQRVLVTGLFGYTDPEPGGSFVGKTPERIRRSCLLLALRGLSPLWSGSYGGAQAGGSGIKSETTRDQSVTYQDDPRLAYAVVTGDPEVDAILSGYRALPFVGGTY